MLPRRLRVSGWQLELPTTYSSSSLKEWASPLLAKECRTNRVLWFQSRRRDLSGFTARKAKTIIQQRSRCELLLVSVSFEPFQAFVLLVYLPLDSLLIIFGICGNNTLGDVCTGKCTGWTRSWTAFERKNGWIGNWDGCLVFIRTKDGSEIGKWKILLQKVYVFATISVWKTWLVN